MQTKRLWRILTWAGLLGLLLALPVLAAPQESHRAGLVIDFGDGRVSKYCVTFTEQTLTGYELLQRTGLEIASVFESNGVAVCRIGGATGAGCAQSNCFCQFPPKYWSYWNRQGGTWAYSTVGASSAQVSDGMVNGWLWGDATQPPATTSFDDICAPAEPTPTNTPTATATATPTATPTPSPTATPTPSPTATSHAPQSQAAQATATPEPYANLWADAEELEAGTCAMVHWETVGMTVVRLDGEAVSARGTETVCPCESQKYELEATYPDGSTEIVAAKIEVNGVCAGGGMAMMVTDTPAASSPGTSLSTAIPTPGPGRDRGTPPSGEQPPTGTPGGERQDPPRDTPAAPSEGAPGTFLSILPTPTPPLPPNATSESQRGLLGSVTPSPELAPEVEATWTPVPTVSEKATLPAGTASELLATPMRHLMDEPDAEAGASAYIPEPMEGAPEALEEASSAAELVLQNWSGYLTFGLMLVALGGAHLFIQRRDG